MDGCRAPMLSGVWYFMAGRCAPLLHACVASWLAVVLPCFQACGASWLAVVLPFGWVGSLEASARILQPGTQAGARTHSPVRRRSPSKSKFQRNKNERLLLYISII